MNERIKLLISQAEIFANRTVPQLKGNQTYWWQVRDEKFAELIVKDCIEIVEPCKCGCSCEQEVTIADSIIADIKGHFGVEK